MLITDLAQLAEVVFGRNSDAAFPLDGFNKNGHDIGVVLGDSTDRFDIIEGRTNKPFDQGLKTRLGFSVSSSGQRGESSVFIPRLCP